ncbi:Metallo-beta-lactamase superfamily protein [Halobiforma haloterrestris]|uniref:Metallo-beta-lactamase superfamily protein n=1 Tax=Natronobacterium haloterrestre TaxID=148448 RepID=A0A1I1LLD4_NATHA|nr:Metallo-beta-lactamase superfamily protein [Halobiforma haloterrestris]
MIDGRSFDVGNDYVGVVHTPGHSPGGVTFELETEALLTGDTLFHESVGRVELGVTAGLERSSAAENAGKLYESLRRLRGRDADPVILPAHDPGSPEPPVAARFSDIAPRNADLRRTRSTLVDALTSDIPDHPPNFQRIKRANTGVTNPLEEELSTLERGPNRCAAN